MARFKDLAGRAGRWIGLAAPPPRHTQAVETDRFDQREWADVARLSSALSDLAGTLSEDHPHVPDLLADLFAAAFKVMPRVRETSAMEPSRVVNRSVVAALLKSPEFTDLRRETMGDRYAAAIAVISQGERLAQLLAETQEARDAAERAGQARASVRDAAHLVADVIDRCSASTGEDAADVPKALLAELENTLAAAEQAEAAAQTADIHATEVLDASAFGTAATLRSAAAAATQRARQDKTRMAAWGVGPGELQRMDFATRAALAERLASPRLAAFAAMIGRFQAMARGQRAQRIRNAPGELIGLVPGDDLARLLPSELSCLAVPALRAVFAVRLAEQQLMMYDQHGEQPAGRGPIIACVDCSDSMQASEPGGITREIWAKACVLALLEQARVGKRDFICILFSHHGCSKTFAFPARQTPTISDVLDLAEEFLGGGTDFVTPMEQAAELLGGAHAAAGVRQGDIVLITDGECGLDAAWLQAWGLLKARLGFRVFGIAVAQSPGAGLRALADITRSVADLTNPEPAKDLFTLI